jgi:hypothetical protein
MLKLVSVFALLLTIGVGNVWGDTYGFFSETVTELPGSWSNSGGNKTINGIQWTYSSSTTIQYDNSHTKIQVGSKNNPQTTAWTIQTPVSSFGSGKKITAVTITAYTTATPATYGISVGGSSVKSGSLTTSSSTYSATGLSITSGDIVVTMTGSSTSKAMYLCNISVTYENAASCSTNPTVGSASLNGSISLSSFPVQTTGWTVGSNCAWTDFGFVWSSTVSTPTLAANGTASSGCTKIQKATSGTSTSTTHSITGSFETGTTYYVRGYGKNGYASGTYQYTDVLTITPRSVEFNSNGGSAVDTKYVNSGTKVTAPSDPTKTGYNFGEWQLNSSEFDFANTNVTSNITLVATWTAKTTTVSFNQNSGTGGQTGTLTATYGSAMPSAPVTCPTRTGYDFGGYYDGSGGSGTQYYTSTGASARNWDKEDASYTLYAKWTIKSFSVTWIVNGEEYTTGTPSSSVDFGSHVATLPTPPAPPCGDKFMGWTTTNIGSVGQATDEGLNLFTTAGGAPTISAEGPVTYYAVFADYDE